MYNNEVNIIPLHNVYNNEVNIIPPHNVYNNEVNIIPPHNVYNKYVSSLFYCTVLRNLLNSYADSFTGHLG